MLPILAIFLFPFLLHSQSTLISLYITDESTGEPLVGAVAYSLPDTLGIGFTLSDGQIHLPPEVHTETEILVSYLGYETVKLRVEDCKSDGFIDVPMVPDRALAIDLVNPAEVIGRRGISTNEAPGQVQLIRAAEIQSSLSGNSADVLENVGGLYIQRSQQGGGSPILRGFEANRVLLVVDGMRLNNAIFRGGHLQNAITIDPNALERVEVLSGPGSLEFGSDAIGGVVHFRTRQPSFASDFGLQNLSVSTQYGTASRHRQIQTSFEIGSRKWASLTVISANAFDDLRAGANRPDAFPDFGRRDTYVLPSPIGLDSIVNNDQPNRQVFSGYDQIDLLHKQMLQLGNNWQAQLNIQFSTSSDIPRYDQLTQRQGGQPRWAEWYYGPQTRLLTGLRLEHNRSTSFYDYFSLLVGRQFMAEDRIQRRFQDPIREISEVDVEQWTAQADFDKSIGEAGRLGYGFDGRTDWVNSRASIDDLSDENPPNVGGPSRYPSQGSRLSSIGTYIDYRYAKNNWRYGAGLRANRQWLRARFGTDDPIRWPQSYIDGIGNEQTSVTGAASMQRIFSQSRLRLLFAQAFRAPNVDDFAKFRERNGFIQVPNPGLRPERSNTLELGWKVFSPMESQGGSSSLPRRELEGGSRTSLSLEINAYYTFLQNAIIRTDFVLPDGSDFFINRGDTLHVQANVNAERARVFGVDLGIQYQFNANWLFAAEGHWLRGRRRQQAPDGNFLWLPQDHIPPAYGRASLQYQKGGWLASLQTRFQLSKSREEYAVSEITLGPDGYIFGRTGTSDNLELTPFDPQSGQFTGVYGWWTLGLNLQKDLGQHWTIRLAIDNIFDQHYRTFGSGISGAGRDLRVGVVWRMK
ncbi:MAG: TonB-dependent receptor [Bacteroidota bacterium]